MPEIQLSKEQLNLIKQQIIEEMITQKKDTITPLAQQKMRILKNKYQKQLQNATGIGIIWDYIQRISAIQLGYRFIRTVPDEKAELVANQAETLVKQVLTAFQKEKGNE